MDLLKGGGNVLKNIVNPMELIKLRNLIGPAAMGFMGLFEAGVITDDVSILGSVSANSILTPATIGGSAATAANASSSIDSSGFAKFASASIAGFIVNTEEIRSSNNNLRLKLNGQITGSNVSFTGGVIANFDIDGNPYNVEIRMDLGAGNEKNLYQLKILSCYKLLVILIPL